MKFGDAVRRVASVDEAIFRMEELGEALGPDGVGNFNRLYMKVTTSISARIKADGPFEPGGFVDMLDVEFANRYFDAVGAWSRNQRKDVPKAWRPLFDRHQTRGITDIQFAAAGVNAHINFDLPYALLRTWTRHHPPDEDTFPSPQRREYDHVTAIFDDLYDDFREDLMGSKIGRFDKGQVRTGLDLASHVVVDRARDLAWMTGDLLYRLSHMWPLGSTLTTQFGAYALTNPTFRIGNLVLVEVPPVRLVTA